MANVKNLTANQIAEIIEKGLENQPVYPVSESSNDYTNQKIILNQGLTDPNNKTKTERRTFKFGDDTNGIKVEFTSTSVTYPSDVTGKNEKFTSLIGIGGDANSLVEGMSLADLFELNIIAKELSMIAEQNLKVQLMVSEGIENLIPLSGPFLYSNIINPESFKSYSDSVLNTLSNTRVSTGGDIVSINQDLLDTYKNQNFISNAYTYSQGIKFIEFLKANLAGAKKYNNTVNNNVVEIKNSEAAPVIVKSNEAAYVQVGSQPGVSTKNLNKILGF